MPRDAPTRPRRGLNGLFANVSSVALAVFGITFFFVGAIAGLSVIGRLGAAGWIIYGFVMGTWALVFGPIIASSVTLRQTGSKRYQRDLEERREWQRRKYRLDHLESEREKRGADEEHPEYK